MYVDAFVSAGTKGSRCSVIFCRYTNRDPLELRLIRKSTSYYKERRMYAMSPALTPIFDKHLSVRTNRLCMHHVKTLKLNNKNKK
jgi:hypothetical protein